MRRILTPMRAAATAVALVAVAAGCGSSDAPDAARDRPTIAVTTSVWGDVVEAAVGELADVEVVMPAGADPHDFAPSARQAELMEDADLVVVNGLGLEAAMTAVVDRVAATGTPVVELASVVDPIVSAGGGTDPHVWLDPTLVVAALRHLGDELAASTTLDATAVDAAIDEYVARVETLDEEITESVAAIPPERRLLVTNHDSYAYFARRYGFEVVGTVIPSTNTSASASASGLVELAERVRALGVPAVFAESTEPDELARALAAEAGDGVVVVELNGGSLGPAGSGAEDYLGLMRTDTARIVAALTAG